MDEAKMKPEDLKLLIQENEMLKHCLKVMNKIPLNDESVTDYMELWNNVALTKKEEIGEVSGEAIMFYFQLLSLGYDNFGIEFFKRMVDSENDVYLFYALKCFIDYMSSYTENEKNNDNNESN